MKNGNEEVKTGGAGRPPEFCWKYKMKNLGSTQLSVVGKEVDINSRFAKYLDGRVTPWDRTHYSLSSDKNVFSAYSMQAFVWMLEKWYYRQDSFVFGALVVGARETSGSLKLIQGTWGVREGFYIESSRKGTNVVSDNKTKLISCKHS